MRVSSTGGGRSVRGRSGGRGKGSESACFKELLQPPLKHGTIESAEPSGRIHTSCCSRNSEHQQVVMRLTVMSLVAVVFCADVVSAQITRENYYSHLPAMPKLVTQTEA